MILKKVTRLRAILRLSNAAAYPYPSLVTARSAEVLNLFSGVFVSYCRQALNLPMPCEHRTYQAT